MGNVSWRAIIFWGARLKEYIEREAAIKEIYSEIERTDPMQATEAVMNYSKGLRIAAALVMNASAADVVERVHGVWLDRRKEDCYTDEEPYVVKMEDGCPEMSCYCSICGDWLTASDEYSVRGNFCPNCGADMREEET